VVDGSPPDCVRAAVALPGEPRPDWVLSGINHGSNLGIDIYNSGTVAAAREAGFLGIPALAISQLRRQPVPDDWPRTTREAAAVIAAILRPDEPPPGHADVGLHRATLATLRAAMTKSGGRELGPFWNINLPLPDAGQTARGVEVTSVSRDPYAMDFRIIRDADGVEYCENQASYHARPATEGTDVAAVFRGWVSLSPLRWSDYRA
jgi:5'-nucleotidase